MNKKSIISGLIILLLITFSFSTVYATKENVTLEKAEDNICEILLEEDGKLVKRLISVDNKNKEATLQIEVENSNSQEEIVKPSEIFLVIDNSESMSANKLEDGTPRKEAVFTAAKQLVHNILKNQNTTKIGIVSFSTNSDTTKEGTIEDASLVIKSTSQEEEIVKAIDSIQTTGARTNIDAGLQLAKTNFKLEDNLNKYLILLTDGVPNTAVGGPTMTYSGDVTTKTKATLEKLKESGINIVTVMTGVNSKTQPDPTGATSPSAAGKTYEQLAQEIFGTQESANYGKFYYVTDSDVSKIITSNVYSDVTQIIKNEIKNITIVDYFPDDIIENYNYQIVEKANIGNVSAEVNTQNNSITWTIEKLAAGEKASFKYKLKLKEQYNEKILNVIMPTNQKVEATYTKDEQKTKTSDVSPKIVLKGDNTVAPEVIPQTGDNTPLILGGITILATISIAIYKNQKTK